MTLPTLTLLTLLSLTSLVTPHPTSTSDGRAATIYKHANLVGLNNDSTFIPANGFCTDISNIFGGFDGRIESLSVEKGFRCAFYEQARCGVNDFAPGGKVLEVGFRNRKDERRQLGSWKGRIASVFCQKL